MTTDEAIEAAARALAISWFGSGVDEYAVAEVRPDAEAALRAAAPALMEHGARLALEAAISLWSRHKYSGDYSDAIDALDPAAIVKGQSDERKCLECAGTGVVERICGYDRPCDACRRNACCPPEGPNQ